MPPSVFARFHIPHVMLGLGLIALLAGGAAATPLDEVRQLVENARYAEAETAARKLLEDLVASGRGDSLETAQVLDVLVSAVRQGKADGANEALPLAERSLAIKEALLPADHPDLVGSLNTVGTLLNGAGDYGRARTMNERALAIREKTLGPDHPDVAKSLALLANSLAALGDYAGALRLYERAVAIRERALGPDHVDVAKGLIGVATQATKLGDFATAQPLFERALGILERELGPEDPSVAICLNNYANMLSDLGDNEGAIRLHERALAIREKAFGPKHVSLAMTLNNMGNMLSDAGDYAKAARHLERAKTIWEGTVGPDHPFVGMVLDNLGSVHARMGDIETARALHERSLAVREQALGPDHPDVALSLVNLANLLRDHGENADYARADSLYTRALAIRERTLSPDHPLVAIVLNDRSALLAMTGAKREAYDLALRGETISRQHLWLMADGLTEREMLGYAETRPSGLPAALSIVAGAQDPKWSREAWDTVIRSRAIVLDEMATRHRAGGQAESREIAPLRADFVATSRRLANLIVRGPGGEDREGYRRLVDEAREEREQAERALLAKSAAYREEEASRRIGVAEVGAALPPGSALVAYSRYERVDLKGVERPPYYLAFVMSGQSQDPDVVPLGPAGVVDTLVSQWLEQAGRGILDVSRPERAIEAACRMAGSALRQKVWDPVAAKVGRAELVFVVPDGALHLVNFAALPDGDSTVRYLVEKAPVFHFLSAERDLIGHSDRVSRGEGLLALGGPDFEATSQMLAVADAALPPTGEGVWFRGGRSKCGNFAERRFEQLPAAAREATEVAASWTEERQGTLILTGAAASEAAFKREAPARRTLHLATHGFFIRDECRGENPLLLSGLVMAGANHRDAAGPDEEDGILTAEEIAALDLERAELTVLSGCDTGVGETAAGEGVLGLRRAFEVAGAKTLAMSLWPVDDESTREWMRALYERRFRDRMETARAVQEASRAILRARRERKMTTHPFHWGAFVAAGDWK